MSDFPLPVTTLPLPAPVAPPQEFFVEINGRSVPVTGENVEVVLAAPKFQAWIAEIDPAFVYARITIQATTVLTNKQTGVKSLLFALLHCDVTKGGNRAPGVVFFRGGAVAVLPVITLIGSDKRYTVLTVQARVPAGRADLIEAIAGMKDSDTNTVRVAAKELQEEAWMKVLIDQFIALGSVYPSPGGCDETIDLFAFEITMTQEELDALKGKSTGVLGEGEIITTLVVELDEVPVVASTDAKALLLYFLWKQHEASIASYTVRPEAVRSTRKLLVPPV